MLQCFNHHKFSTSFEGEGVPRLLYSCRTQGQHATIPRIMHRHANIAELVFVVSGSGVHDIDGKKFNTQKGDLLVYNAGVLHDESTDPDSQMSVYCIAATNLNLKGRPSNCFIRESLRPVINVEEEFEQFHTLFQMIHECILSDSPQSAEQANYLLRAVILKVDQLSNRNATLSDSPESAIGKQIKRYIDDHYAEDFSLDELADRFYLNRYYLSHIFKDTIGYSPLQYVIRRRIGEAQSLLINSEHSVTQIATMVGYNNSNHFHSAFVRMAGMTPAKYRKCWVKQT